MIFKENISLAQYTTFKIGGLTRFYARVRSEEDVVAAVKFSREKKVPIFILGGGSNILVSDAGFPGLTIKIGMKGISFGEVDKESGAVLVKAAAGELWDEVVDQSVQRELYGLENLSAIPGTVGAAPIQNIGAYGAEAAEVIHSVRAFDTQEMKFVDFSNTECQFSYRDSIFKKQKRYIVTSVTFKIFKNGRLNTTYKDLNNYLLKNNINNPTLKQVREAIIDIRWGKLPDWKLWGTAGSYFKNPIITNQEFFELQKKYTDLPGYPESDGRVKVSLGWILDKVCNVRGLCIGNVCTYENQALVIIAKPGATAAEVVKLTKELMERVKEATGILITAEVEWVN